MDRRKSLKTIAIGTVSASLIMDACKTEPKKDAPQKEAANTDSADRMAEEIAYNKELASMHFFTEDEMATIHILSDIIIPKDEISGSATEAGVPAFIDFIVNDMPEHQIPLRGGLRWLDIECLNKYNAAFKECTPAQQIEIVDMIAYPKKAKPEMEQGVAFFNRMRNLTATGFFTSKIGVQDIGYAGNKPNQWNGVPDDVLKQYNLAYTEKELKECIQFDKA
ncbi:MAG: gluconate 2-dehydrogenase subunit 3 family protein [Bacteroidetes bacterium]|nr:gluconate 2-dehydrogenase subunit 3 family protein [Bacteroidota bacterium]